MKRLHVIAKCSHFLSIIHKFIDWVIRFILTSLNISGNLWQLILNLTLLLTYISGCINLWGVTTTISIFILYQWFWSLFKLRKAIIISVFKLINLSTISQTTRIVHWINLYIVYLMIFFLWILFMLQKTRCCFNFALIIRPNIHIISVITIYFWRNIHSIICSYLIYMKLRPISKMFVGLILLN